MSSRCKPSLLRVQSTGDPRGRPGSCSPIQSPWLFGRGNKCMWIAETAIVVDRHIIAGISVAGTICDVMGGLYLAYDLLGGYNGPLRTVTRVVTYTLIFCLG